MARRDLKVKRVEPSPHLGVDSPMVIWFADLESLGLKDVVFHRGGGSLGGSPDPKPGGNAGGDFEPVDRYVAVCEEVQHPARTPGALADGRWVGSLHDQYHPALIEASAHEHVSAYVALYTRGTFIGPVKQH